MASLYKFRGRWIRYKQGGKWKGKATKYKIDNIYCQLNGTQSEVKAQ